MSICQVIERLSKSYFDSKMLCWFLAQPYFVFTWHLSGLLDKTNHLDFFLSNINGGGAGRLNEYCFHIKEP